MLRKELVSLWCFLAAMLALHGTCLAADADEHKAKLLTKDSKVRLVSSIKLIGEDGKEIGKCLTLRFPMPEGLAWNTEFRVHEERNSPNPAQLFAWDRERIAIHDQVYLTGRRQLLTSEKEGLVRSPLGPYYSCYYVTVLIPLADGLADAQTLVLRWGDSIKKPDNPSATLTLTKQEIDDREVPLEAKVLLIEPVEAPGGNGWSAALALNSRVWLGAKVDQIRVGGVDAAGEWSYRGNELYARFTKPLDPKKPVLLKLEGMDKWVRCQKLPLIQAVVRVNGLTKTIDGTKYELVAIRYFMMLEYFFTKEKNRSSLWIVNDQIGITFDANGQKYLDGVKPLERSDNLHWVHGGVTLPGGAQIVAPPRSC